MTTRLIYSTSSPEIAHSAVKYMRMRETDECAFQYSINILGCLSEHHISSMLGMLESQSATLTAKHRVDARCAPITAKFITAKVHHRESSSPRKSITAKIHHRECSSPRMFITAKIHHRESSSPRRILADLVSQRSFYAQSA